MATQEALLSPKAFLSAMFFQKVQAAFMGSFVSEVTTLVQSNQASETYKWLDEVPGMTEWRGSRTLSGMSSDEYVLPNKVFTAGIKLSREDMRRDTSGQISIRIGELATRAAQHAEQLLTERIEEALSAGGEGYDGVTFWNSSHVRPAFDNAIDISIAGLPAALHGSLANPSPEEASGVILQGVQQLLTAKDVRGLPINAGASNFGCMVPVDLSPAFMQAASAQNMAHGGPNPLTNNGGMYNVKVVVNPYLGDTWDAAPRIMVWNKDAAVRPFIYQVEESPRFDFLGEGTEQSMMNRAHLALTEWTGNVGYGRHTSAVEVTLLT